MMHIRIFCISTVFLKYWSQVKVYEEYLSTVLNIHGLNNRIWKVILSASVQSSNIDTIFYGSSLWFMLSIKFLYFNIQLELLKGEVSHACLLHNYMQRTYCLLLHHCNTGFTASCVLGN